ncbi:MAG: glutamate--tRNA ligase family protein [Phycisphaerales bacterium]
MSVRRTRIAPSPTGSLHLGNARTFALNWALARNEGWEIVLRVEDLDAERVKPGAREETLAVLDWLGIDHDGEVVVQSADLEPYRAAMRTLAARGRVFRCDRSRQDVRRAASAPHVEDAELRYDPSLRPAADAFAFVDERANHRLLVDPGAERVRDELRGDCAFDPGVEVGDFLVWTKLGVPSYQLAVVVDDIRNGVTDVVRGDDLFASAARQQLLYRLLGAPTPRWWHLPLLHAADGRRLAKRHDDLSLASLRAAGVRRERVLGLVAAWSGFVASPRELASDDFRGLVTVDTLRAMTARERASADARARVLEEDVQWLYQRDCDRSA